MGTKEVKRGIIASGSPLMHHSLNQGRMKSHIEGERRTKMGVDREDVTALEESVNFGSVPLSKEFLEGCFNDMIQIAQQRILEEESVPIPRRIVNVVTDVEKIYGIARKKGLHTRIVPVDENSDSVNLPIRKDYHQYTGLFPYQIFIALLNKPQFGGMMSHKDKSAWLSAFPPAFIGNITSCDFTLPPRELLVERVQTYSYVLATLAHLVVSLPQQYRERVPDFLFPAFLSVAKKYLRR